MWTRIPIARAVLLAAAFGFSPAPAEAGMVLVTHGDTLTPMGTVAPQFRGERLPATTVGFKYSYFGVFWIDLWTWGGTYCLYQGNQYWELDRAKAAQLMGKSESELGKPFLYTFPLGLLILAPVGILWAVVSHFQRPPPNPVVDLLKDERYQQALVLFHEQMGREEVPAAPEGAIQTDVPPPAPPADDGARRQQKMAAAWEAAVSSLTAQGVERALAEEKLSLLLAATQRAPA